MNSLCNRLCSAYFLLSFFTLCLLHLRLPCLFVLFLSQILFCFSVTCFPRNSFTIISKTLFFCLIFGNHFCFTLNFCDGRNKYKNLKQNFQCWFQLFNYYKLFKKQKTQYQSNTGTAFFFYLNGQQILRYNVMDELMHSALLFIYLFIFQLFKLTNNQILNAIEILYYLPMPINRI